MKFLALFESDNNYDNIFKPFSDKHTFTVSLDRTSLKIEAFEKLDQTKQSLKELNTIAEKFENKIKRMVVEIGEIHPLKNNKFDYDVKISKINNNMVLVYTVFLFFNENNSKNVQNLVDYINKKYK